MTREIETTSILSDDEILGVRRRRTGRFDLLW